eukprot:g6806.t1
MENRGAGAARRGRGGGGGGGDGARGISRGRGKGKRPSRQSSAATTTAAGGRGRRGGEAAGGGSGGESGGDSYSTLGKLVSKATKPTRETGYKHLDEDTVRRIKTIARKDENCAAGAARYLMQRMAAKSSEARFMALSIVGMLFQRSRVVRRVVVADLKNFMNLAVGHDARQPLPGPPAAAEALRQKALALLEEWNASHGDLYKGIRAAYRFLREGKRMKFPELQARAARERQAAERRRKHAQRMLRVKYLQAKSEIAEQAPEIETMVREMRECFTILVPAVPGTDAISVDHHEGQDSGERRRAERAFPEEGRSDGGGGGGGSSRSALAAAAAAAAAADGGDVGSRNLVGGVGAGSDNQRRGEEENGEEPGGTTDAKRALERPNGAEAEGSRQEEEKDQLGKEEEVMPAIEADGAEDAAAAGSDGDEGMEWEDGGGGDWESGKREDEEEEEQEEEEGGGDGDVHDEDGAGGRKWKRSRWSAGAVSDGGNDSLQTIADTVEAAGLGSSGYELQVEVPMGWSVSTGGEGDDGRGSDAALVVSALRERYKVLTTRLLPLLSDWIQTLSRIHFDVEDDLNGGSDGNNTRGSGLNQGHPSGSAAAAFGPSTAIAEVRVCSSLLSRCLAARNSANTVVSKFVELRIDEEEEACGGGSRKGGGGRSGGTGSGSSASSAGKKPKPRLQIRLEDVRGRGRGIARLGAS